MRYLIAIVVVAVLLALLASTSLFVVNENEQVVITRFGKVVRSVQEPGLNFKAPFVDSLRTFDKRWLEWDGDPNQIPTLDKKYISVDTFARWRIVDPQKFFERLRDESSAQSRLDDILDGETRNAIASYDLIEAVRTTGRKFEVTEESEGLLGDQSDFAIDVGRDKIAQEILERAIARIRDIDAGIELADIRLKRIDYIEEVRQTVYDRMISERQRIASENRSEGQGQSAEIRGQMERELSRIRSEAFRTTQEIRGKADAESTRIYAEAYSRDTDFYRFMKSLETLEKAISDDTQVVLSTDSELFRMLESSR